jgi:2-(3-amino-3-carboxypropyl)histidine synthase
MEFDLEIGRIIAGIKKDSAKSVLLQLPDGLKPRAKQICDELQQKTGARILIWGGSCFGACDVPNISGIDLLVQFGHSEWR